jgi:hypothetical protein
MEDRMLGKHLIAVLLAAWAAPSCAEERPPLARGEVRLTEDRFAGGFAVEAEEAPLERILAALARASGCRAEIAPELKERKLTLNLVARPPERLFLVLARRAKLRAAVTFRFTRLEAGPARRPGSLLFARQPVSHETREPVLLEQALRDLDVRFQLEPEVNVPVRVRAVRHTLGAVLDNLAAQANAKRNTVVRLEQRAPGEDAAAEYERSQAHFFELARLPEAERREELLADLEEIESLTGDPRALALERTSQNVLSLESYLHNDSGEFPGPIWRRVEGVVADYWVVLRRLTPARREHFSPLVAALEELRRRVERIRGQGDER